MHLRGYPKYFVKDGKRRPVYYTIEASELLQSGWRLEVDSAVAARSEDEPLPEPTFELAEVEAEINAEPEPEPEPEPEAPEADTKVEVEVVKDEPETSHGETVSEELPDFEFMTKAELIGYAGERGVELKLSLTKAELVEICEAL